MKWWLCSDMTDFPLGKEGCQAQMEKIPKGGGEEGDFRRRRRGTLGGSGPRRSTAESGLEEMPFHLVKM